MPSSQNNNDLERYSESHFNITNNYIENKRPHNECKNVMCKPVSKIKTETIRSIIDKYIYKYLGFEYKKEKRNKKDSGDFK